MSDLEEPKPGISRRTVAKAAAWSVPAIALAVSTPAYAASPGFLTVTGDGCKLPGNATDVYKGYAFEGSISNDDARRRHHCRSPTSPSTVRILEPSLLWISKTASSWALRSSSPTRTIDLRVAILTQGAGNSANGTLVISYTVDGAPDQVTATADAAPPIVGGGACTTFSAAEKLCLAVPRCLVRVNGEIRQTVWSAGSLSFRRPGDGVSSGSPGGTLCRVRNAPVADVGRMRKRRGILD